MTLHVAVMFSGGKDSTYTIWLLQHQGWDVDVLVTVKPQTPASFMFHYPAIDSTTYLSKALGIPQVIVRPEHEDELKDLAGNLNSLKRDYGIEGLATGAVASDYQKTRFDNICESIALRSFSPLWHKSPAVLVRDLEESGIRAIVTGVAARGLDQSWLGRELDAEAWRELGSLSRRYGLHMMGEGGEYESFVLDAPNFQKSVRVDHSSPVWNGQSGHLIIEKASLVEKGVNGLVD